MYDDPCLKRAHVFIHGKWTDCGAPGGCMMAATVDHPLSERETAPPEKVEPSDVDVFTSFLATADQIDEWRALAREVQNVVGWLDSPHGTLFTEFVNPLLEQAHQNARAARARRE